MKKLGQDTSNNYTLAQYNLKKSGQNTSNYPLINATEEIELYNEKFKSQFKFLEQMQEVTEKINKNNKSEEKTLANFSIGPFTVFNITGKPPRPGSRNK